MKTGGCEGIATVVANGYANAPQGGPVLLFLPTVTRSVLTPRQAPATNLSWTAGCRVSFFHTGRLEFCRWAVFFLTLACWGGNDGRNEEEDSNRTKSSLSGGARTGCGWGLDRGVGVRCFLGTGRGARAAAVGNQGWRCSEHVTDRLDLQTLGCQLVMMPQNLPPWSLILPSDDGFDILEELNLNPIPQKGQKKYGAISLFFFFLFSDTWALLANGGLDWSGGFGGLEWSDCS